MNSIRGQCRFGWSLLVAATVLMLSGSPGAGAAVGVPDRGADPVVLTGSSTPALIGIPPGEVVAFRWDGAWKQVPVQVDERKIADYRVIRQLPMSSKGFKAEVYADPDTYAGADGVAQMSTTSPSVPVPGTEGDPNLDQDDEIALMSKDAGTSAAGKPDPAGVDGITRTPVRIKDPLAPQTLSYLYLFRKSSDLDPAAGTDYVSYDWKFEPALVPGYFKGSGSAGPGYNFGSLGDNVNGPPVNPEASSVETALYEQTFPGRWMVDGLSIKAGSSTGVDILDGDKSTVGPAGCGRNELTFSRGGGGFIAAIDGPIRAIRSYIGANSGTYTQRDQTYYEGRVDTRTFLRVHPGIDNLMIAADYSEAAKGMTYRNSLNPAGVTVDGAPDAPAPGQLAWEQVDGKQGSATFIARVSSDITPLHLTSFYQDDVDPEGSSMLCSGDDHAFGASGPKVIGTGAYNTDPTISIWDERPIALSTLTADRHTYIDAPGTTKETAILRSQQVDSPLVLATGAASDPTTEVPDPDPDPGETPGRTSWVGLSVSVKPKHARVRAGVTRTFKVTVRNIGDLTGKELKVCPIVKGKLVRTSDCQKLKKLKSGKAGRFKFRATPRRAAKGKKLELKFRAKASKSKARSAVVMLTIPFGR
jgi:hypothetical protein